MDIIYKEISWIKYKSLPDRSGYYKVIGNGEYYTFEKDSRWHNETGPAVFCKLKAFQ